MLSYGIEYVHNGTKLLDHVMPNWHKRINIETLDLGNRQFCILGQLYGDYLLGLRALGLSNGCFNGFCNVQHKDFWLVEIRRRNEKMLPL